jgi:hypothetical protein
MFFDGTTKGNRQRRTVKALLTCIYCKPSRWLAAEQKSRIRKSAISRLGVKIKSSENCNLLGRQRRGRRNSIPGRKLVELFVDS